MHTGLNFLEAAAVGHPVSVLIGFIVLRSTSVLWPPIPGLPMDLLGIRVFGATSAFVAAEVGIMLGATAAFFVARAARPMTRTGSTWSRLTNMVEAGSPFSESDAVTQFRRWFVLRLLTNPLFDPLCYVGGLTHTTFRPFFWATLLGNLPSMAAFYLLARGARENAGPIQIMILSLIFAAAIWYTSFLWIRTRATVTPATLKRE